MSTKIHAVVDQDFLPVRLLISPGQASDVGAVPQLLEGLPVLSTVVAHRGYDSNAILDLLRAWVPGRAFQVVPGASFGVASIPPSIDNAT